MIPGSSLVLPYENNVRDYGYFEVGDQKFLDKRSALEYSEITSQPIHWNFCERTFDQHDWGKEPTESLNDLYAERCRQLRNDYDYLVLHYGGGHDCQNILDTCIKNNIFIDEILIMGVFINEQDPTLGNNPYNHFSESWVFGIPYANYVKETHFPHMKVTVLEVQQHIRDFFSDNPDWFYRYGNIVLDPGSIGRKVNYNRLQPHYLDLSRKGKKVAHIIGTDKPRILKDNEGYFYFQAKDNMIIRQVLMHDDSENLPYYVELFYWHPNSAKMIIKQCHVLCNRFMKDGLHPLKGFATDRSREDYMARFLYERSHPLTFTVEKVDRNSLLYDHSFWWDREKGSLHHQNWRKGIIKLLSNKAKDDPTKVGNINQIIHPESTHLYGKRYFIMREDNA